LTNMWLLTMSPNQAPLIQSNKIKAPIKVPEAGFNRIAGFFFLCFFLLAILARLVYLVEAYCTVTVIFSDITGFWCGTCK